MTQNICSCVVYSRPGEGRSVGVRLAALAGVEVHGGSELDRLVVTVEDTHETLAADTVGALNQVPGVINAVLIYHYGGDDLEPPAGRAADKGLRQSGGPSGAHPDA